MPRKPKPASEYSDDGSVKKSVSIPKDLLIAAEARFAARRVKTLSAYIQQLIEDDARITHHPALPEPFTKRVSSPKTEIAAESEREDERKNARHEPKRQR